MNTELSWDTVKEFYQEQFGIDGWVIEMYANLDILMLCASGACNETISNFLEIPNKDIQKVIRDTFEFDGWEIDLPANPYRLYNEMVENEGRESTFISEMQSALRTMQGMINREFIISKSYWISRTLSEIEERITNEWI